MIKNNNQTIIKRTILALVFLGTTIFFVYKPEPQNNRTQKTNINIDGSLVESMIYLKYGTENNHILPWNEHNDQQSIREFYTAELKKHEDKLWQQAQKLGISQTKFNYELNNRCYKFTNDHASRSGALSNETISLVEEVLKQCGLDPKTIEIIGQTERTVSPATTTSKTIYVYEPRIKMMHPNAVKFIIAHEATHIKYQDGWARGVMKMLMSNNGSTQEQEKILDTFGRFQETRADIEAILYHPEYARGGIEFFETLQKTSHCDTKMHPRNTDRISLCQTVTAAWQEMGLTHL